MKPPIEPKHFKLWNGIHWTVAIIFIVFTVDGFLSRDLGFAAFLYGCFIVFSYIWKALSPKLIPIFSGADKYLLELNAYELWLNEEETRLRAYEDFEKARSAPKIDIDANIAAYKARQKERQRNKKWWHIF